MQNILKNVALNGTKRGIMMSREIKFRAWLKEDKKMENVKTIDFTDKTIRCLKKNEFINAYLLRRVSFDDVELMQYTNLKDKNGKEIYEGDVVKLVHFKDGRKKETGKVIFLHSQAGFGIIDRDGNEYPLFRNTAKQIEIIENPELLEENN